MFTNGMKISFFDSYGLLFTEEIVVADNVEILVELCFFTKVDLPE